MDSWNKYDKTSLSDKEDFYSSPNIEGITNVDYRHEKIMNNLADYHNLYVQSDTLLLADLFENFRNKCIEMYEHDPASFLPAPGLP